MRRIISACLLLIVLLACSEKETPTAPEAVSVMPLAAANGPIIQHFPGDSPGAPWYALLGYGFVPTNGEWVGIVFTRSPDCVPTEFNLLQQFNPPAAWNCTLTVEGELFWHDLSAPPPFQERAHSLGATPVYFVALSELQAAIADNVLTIGELQDLPSLLIGYASFLEQVVHNTNQPTNHGHETLVAHGKLENGQSFEFRYNEKFLPESGEHVFPNVKIAFR
jgi:hypothetical protein